MRGLVNNCVEVGTALGVECRPVIFVDGAFCDVPALPTASPQRSRRQKLREWGGRMLRSVLPTGAASSLIRNMKGWEARRGAGDRTAPLQLTPRDVIVLADTSWHLPYERVFDVARAAGATVGCVVYDLIPLRAPDLLPPRIVAEYRSWFDAVVPKSDFCLTISRWTRDDLLAYMREAGGARVVRAEAFKLAAEIGPPPSAAPAVRAGIRQILERAPKPWITVGSIEPRKNQEFVLDAFESAWREGSDLRLCIVGKVHPFAQRILDRIRTHAEFGRRLDMINDATDDELAFAYGQARGLVYASSHEGYGLPIVEALARNVRVLASDTPVHREVGADACTYFPLGSPAELARLLQAPPPSKPGAAPDVAKTWGDACEDFVRKALQLAGG